LIEIAIVRSTFSPIEDRQVDLAEACGIGNDVDVGDLTLPNPA
jgi:hypothetical protein